jgi:hypothetical protein
VNGDKTILKWDIGGTEVLEMPGYEVTDGLGFFTRTFEVAATREELVIPLFTSSLEKGASSLHNDGQDRRVETQIYRKEDRMTGVILIAPNGGPAYDKSKPYRDQVTDRAGTCVLRFPPSGEPRRFQVRIWTGRTSDELTAIRTYTTGGPDFVAERFALPKLAALTKGGPARWPATVTTAGEVSDKKDEAYVVDTIKLPDPNPWGAPMFVGGFDFFPDGRAAVCTFHGDVFVVSGIDAGLEQVTWKRFASGLYHALGLKIVNGKST